jgi:chromate transporter
MILFKLFLSFLKIGVFAFGGGYAMIPLIQQEIVIANKWLTMEEFVDLIAIAEMTPGPIAVNSATFVGYRVAGLTGSVVCTLAIVLLPFAIILVISRIFLRYRKSRVVQLFMEGIRPAVVALILAAALSVGKATKPDIAGIIISLLIFWAVMKKKFHPILLIAASGMTGVLLNVAGVW